MSEMTRVVSKHRRVRIVGPAIGSFLAALAVSVALPSTAHAGPWRLGLDLDYENGIDEEGVSGGTGAALRFGYKLNLAILSITPEIGGAGSWFGGPADSKLYQGFLGGRVSFLKGIEPGVFAHVGYGSIKVLDESRGGTTIDAGVALDITLLPIVDLGIHAAYDSMFVKDADKAFDWYRVGAHAALAF